MSVYHALYLDNMTEYHLREKLSCLYDILPTQILELYLQGPSSIYILVTDHVSAMSYSIDFYALGDDKKNSECNLHQSRVLV